MTGRAPLKEKFSSENFSAGHSLVPVLLTGRLRLRAFRLADFPAFAALHAAPHAALMWALTATDAAWNRFAALAGEWALRGYGSWALADRVTDRFLGHAGFLHPADADDAELGWALVADAQGQGLALEGAVAARDWGRASGLPAPVSHIDARNHRSLRLAQRMGAIETGRTVYAPDAVAVHFRHPAGATA
jgi:RimJ/RimL family protein N-acetyltransferase